MSADSRFLMVKISVFDLKEEGGKKFNQSKNTTLQSKQISQQ